MAPNCQCRFTINDAVFLVPLFEGKIPVKLFECKIPVKLFEDKIPMAAGFLIGGTITHLGSFVFGVTV